MKKIIVIGGGASGLMAAICAARLGAAVTILEKMEKPAKKLQMTGNGRCNLTNTGADAAAAYCGADQIFIQNILKQFTVADTLNFFHDLGLLTKTRADYVYPYTDQAASVLEVLLLELRRWKVKLKCRETVTKIERQPLGFCVKTETWTYQCDQVILAAGGKAVPLTGSDGSGYTLARQCGHRITPILPALVPLRVKEAVVTSLAGTRSPVRLHLQIEDEQRKPETGELQWTEYGVSGIVVFQVSRFAAVALREGKSVKLQIDLLPDYETNQILRLVAMKEQKNPAATREELLAGILQKNVIAALLKSNAKDVTAAELITRARSMTLTVIGTQTFERAQVCAGGVFSEEIDALTLESKKMPGLYMTGELIDVDGICGGYNLQWAWSSAYVAGTHAAGYGLTKGNL